VTEPQTLSESADLEVGEVIGSRYEILGLLGEGAAGAVYRAYDRILDEPVALKFLRGEGTDPTWTTEGFRSEVKLARRVAHPNVCRIYEYGEHDDRPYLSMELIEGATVKQRLAQRGSYPLDDALDLAIQVADALEAIHRAGIVHRDLKPQNLIEGRYGVVKVTDFGIATSSPRDGGADPFVRYVAGTPEYMSPEQVRGLPVDARSDVYALGVVLFELVTGRVPFPVQSAAQTFPQHLQEDRPVPSCTGLPLVVVALLRRALALHREQRYASAEAMAAAMREARAELARLDTGPRRPRADSAATLTHPRLPVPAPPVPTRRAFWAALTASGLVLAGMTSWFAVERRMARSTDVAPSTAGASPAPLERARSAPARPPEAILSAPPAVGPPAPVVPGVLDHDAQGPAAESSERGEGPAGDAAAAAAPAAGPIDDHGWLQLGITPWAHVFVNDVPLGTTPLKRIALSPGTHSIRLENPDYLPLTRKVRIQPGETTTLRLELPLDAIRR
jgi:eukaryotic-like serine/threonine-protein kinase